MTKYGVGVGEEFPVAENKPEGPENEQNPRRCGGRSAHRQAWRQFRDQKKAEWRARRRAFHDRFHGHHHDGEALGDIRAHHLKVLVVGGLAVAGLAALIGALNARR